MPFFMLTRIKKLRIKLRTAVRRAFRRCAGFVPTTESELLFNLFKFMNSVSNIAVFKSISAAMAGYILDMDRESLNVLTHDSEKQASQWVAAINSMTKAERKDPCIIDYKRRRRIAKGAGIRDYQVVEMLSTLEIMRFPSFK